MDTRRVSIWAIARADVNKFGHFVRPKRPASAVWAKLEALSLCLQLFASNSLPGAPSCFVIRAQNG